LAAIARFSRKEISRNNNLYKIPIAVCLLCLVKHTAIIECVFFKTTVYVYCVSLEGISLDIRVVRGRTRRILHLPASSPSVEGSWFSTSTRPSPAARQPICECGRRRVGYRRRPSLCRLSDRAAWRHRTGLWTHLPVLELFPSAPWTPAMSRLSRVCRPFSTRVCLVTCSFERSDRIFKVNVWRNCEETMTPVHLSQSDIYLTVDCSCYTMQFFCIE